MFNIEKLVLSINNSTEKDIHYFRWVLSKVYSFSNIIEFYNNDCENFKKLHDKLTKEKKNFTGKIMIMQIEYLINQTEELISKLEIKST